MATMEYRNGDSYQTCEHGYSDLDMCDDCARAAMPEVERYTCAGEEYDAFGTRTIEWTAWQTRPQYGKRYRKVEILEQHLDWQCARYASGMVSAVDEAEFNKLIGYNLLAPFVEEVESRE